MPYLSPQILMAQFRPRDTHATRSPPIPMAQRHPRNAYSANPNGTAPPTRRLLCQSQRRSAAHATPFWPTPVPTRRFFCQSQWRSATHATPSLPIPTAQRRPRDAVLANPSAYATLFLPIAMAQRLPRDAFPANPNGTAPPSDTCAPQPQLHGYARAPRTRRVHARFRGFRFILRGLSKVDLTSEIFITWIFDTP